MSAVGVIFQIYTMKIFRNFLVSVRWVRCLTADGIA